jgi:O-antigen ligase
LLFAFCVPWEYALDIGPPLGNIARIAGLVLLLVGIPAIFQAGHVRKPGSLQWLVLILYSWFCCSTLWTIDRPETVILLRGYFQEMMTVWLVWEFVETPADLRSMMRAYVAGSWILAALTIAALVSSHSADQIRFVSSGQDPNDVARFLDIGFPMAALLLAGESRGWAKLLALGYLPLGLTGVLLTASRSGFVAAIVAVGGCGLLLVLSHPRRLQAGFLALPALIGALWLIVPRVTIGRLATIPEQLTGGDLNQRLNIWAAGWQAFSRAPLLGTGAGTFVGAAGLAHIDTAHNTALSLLVEGGLPALMIGAAIVAVCAQSVIHMRGAARLALGTALLVLIVIAMVATVTESRSTWLLFAIINVAGRLSLDEAEGMSALFSIRPAHQPLAEALP